MSNSLSKIYQRESRKLLVEMRRDLSRLAVPKDREQALYNLYRCAHTLKSSSADMGRKGVHEIALRLETFFGQLRQDGLSLDTERIRLIGRILAEGQTLLNGGRNKAYGLLLAQLPASAPGAPGKGQPLQQPRKGLKLLLVEDSMYFAAKIRALLREMKGISCRLTHVTTLGAGIKSLKKSSPDLILLDLKLPDSDGLQTVERLMAEKGKVPVAILTATDDEEMGTRAIHAGAQDYMVKREISGPMLMRTIRHATERHRLSQELEQAKEKERQAERDRMQLEIESLRQLLGAKPQKPAAAAVAHTASSVSQRGLALAYAELLACFLEDNAKKTAIMLTNFCNMLVTDAVPTKWIVEIHLTSVKRIAAGLDRVSTHRNVQRARMLLLAVMTRYASGLQEKNRFYK